MAQEQTSKQGAEILSCTWILLSEIEAVELEGNNVLRLLCSPSTQFTLP